MRVSFLGRGSGAAASRLADMLQESDLRCPVVITAASPVRKTDVLVVVSPVSTKRKINCGLLIGSENIDITNIDCERKLSCGMSCENDVTMSSVGEAECFAALRREVKTMSGRIIDRSEMRIKRCKRLSPEALLAVVGCALMLDTPPEKMV